MLQINTGENSGWAHLTFFTRFTIGNSNNRLYVRLFVCLSVSVWNLYWNIKKKERKRKAMPTDVEDKFFGKFLIEDTPSHCMTRVGALKSDFYDGNTRVPIIRFIRFVIGMLIDWQESISDDSCTKHFHKYHNWSENNFFLIMGGVLCGFSF